METNPKYKYGVFIQKSNNKDVIIEKESFFDAVDELKYFMTAAVCSNVEGAFVYREDEEGHRTPLYSVFHTMSWKEI